MTNAIKDGFVAGLSSGLRLAAVVVVVAAFVVWRYLPARAADHDLLPAAYADELDVASVALAVGE